MYRLSDQVGKKHAQLVIKVMQVQSIYAPTYRAIRSGTGVLFGG